MQAAKPRNPDSVSTPVRRQHLDQQPKEEFLGPRGYLRYHNVGGHQMCGYYYPAENAKGVVILVHGQVCPDLGCQHRARLSDAVSATKVPAPLVLQDATLATIGLEVPQAHQSQIIVPGLVRVCMQ